MRITPHKHVGEILLLVLFLIPLTLADTRSDIMDKVTFYLQGDGNCSTDYSVYGEIGSQTDTSPPTSIPHTELTNLGSYCEIGRDSEVEFAMSGQSQFVTLKNWSINYWLRYNSSAPDNTELIAIDEDDGNGINIFYDHDASGGWYYLRHGGSGGTTSIPTTIKTGTIVNNSWMMITIVGGKNANNLTVWLNGKENGTHSVNGAMVYDSPNFRFGGKNSADGRDLQKIDEFIITNQTLTPSEIAWLYNDHQGNSLTAVSYPNATIIYPTASGTHFTNLIEINATCSSGTVYLYYGGISPSLVSSGTSPLLYNISDYSTATGTYFYTANCGGDNISLQNLTYDIDPPDINITFPLTEYNFTEELQRLNASVFDPYLDAVNITLYNYSDNSIKANNFTDSITATLMNISQLYNFSLYGYGSYIWEVCARDSSQDSPVIAGKLASATAKNDLDYTSIFTLNGVKIKRTISIISPSNVPLHINAYDLQLNEQLDKQGKHLKLDIILNKLPSFQHKIKVEFECVTCSYMEFLNDRGRNRIVDDSRTFMIQFDDAVSEGYDLTYMEGQGKASALISADSQKYATLPQRYTIDPILQGLNSLCVNSSLIHFNKPPYAPVANNITSPLNDTIINGSHLITWLEFTDENEGDILIYNVSLFNIDLITLNYSIGTTYSLSLGFDTTQVTDGNYSIKVEGCDDITCASSQNYYIYVNNTPFQLLLNNTAIDFLEVNKCPNNTIQDVLLLAFFGLLIFALYIMVRTIVRVPIITLIVCLGWLFFGFTLMGCDEIIGMIFVAVSLMLGIEAVTNQ